MTSPLGVTLDDDDLTVAEAAEAERVVRRGEELDAREHLTEARHDPHPPARMEVRAELVDQHRALGGVHGRPLPEERDHQVGRERDDRLVAVAQVLEGDAEAERLDVDAARPAVPDEAVVALEREEALQRPRDRVEGLGRPVESNQSVELPMGVNGSNRFCTRASDDVCGGACCPRRGRSRVAP